MISDFNIHSKSEKFESMKQSKADSTLRIPQLPITSDESFFFPKEVQLSMSIERYKNHPYTRNTYYAVRKSVHCVKISSAMESSKRPCVYIRTSRKTNTFPKLNHSNPPKLPQSWLPSSPQWEDLASHCYVLEQWRSITKHISVGTVLRKAKPSKS